MGKKYSVKVEYLRTIQTAWAGSWGADDEYTRQYDHFKTYRSVSPSEARRIQAKYKAPRFRVTTWQVA